MPNAPCIPHLLPPGSAPTTTLALAPPSAWEMNDQRLIRRVAAGVRRLRRNHRAAAASRTPASGLPEGRRLVCAFPAGSEPAHGFYPQLQDRGGGNWTACLINSKFYHVRADGTRGHTADIIRYELSDGSQWEATLSGAGFRHYQKGKKPEQGHDDTRINYVTWNGDSWWAWFE